MPSPLSSAGCHPAHPGRPTAAALALACIAAWAAIGMSRAHSAPAAAPDRQFQNIVFRVPDGHWAVQIGDQGVLIVDAAEARNGRFEGYMTVSSSQRIERDLRVLPIAVLCSSLGSTLIHRQLGAQARFNEYRVVAEAARDGYDACQVAALGQTQDSARRKKAIVYTITRSGDRVATLELHAFGDEKALERRVSAYDALLESADFANRLGRPLAAPRPLPRNLDVYLDPSTGATPGASAPAATSADPRGRNCRMVSSQQCMSQMLGAFPNMTVSYNCLPVQREVCS